MARKTLLTEGEIRQFMKLASLPAVGDARLTEFVGPAETAGEDEASLEEMDIADEEDEEVDLEGGDELDVDAELGGEEELDMDADADLGDVDAVDVDAEELVTRIAHDLESLARMAGVDVDVEDDAPGDEGEELEIDAELGPAEEPGAEEFGAEEEELGPMMEEEDIVNEVARRVASRLKAKESKDEMVSTLAERILNRITNAK